jgi:hypothetical protein
MADPLSVAAIGAVAITEGIKFVYGQASELIKRHRERKEKGAEPGTPIPVEGAEVLDGELKPLTPDYEVLERLEQRVTDLAVELAKYKDGLVAPEPATAKTVQELRDALEAIYGQRLTFKGEDRPESTGTVISGELRARIVKGLAIATDVGSVRGDATVTGTADVDTVDEGGTAIGTRVRDVEG